MRRLRPYLIGGAVAVLAIALLLVYRAGKDAQRVADQVTIQQAQLERENAIARADSSRRLWQADSAVAYRRVQQLELAAIQLTDSLRIQRRMTAELVIRTDTLRARIAAAPVPDSAGVRRQAFHAEQPPITVDVDVEARPDSILALIRASLAPIRLNVTGGCVDQPGSVRAAYVTASAQGFPNIDVGSSTFAPDVCNPLPVPEHRTLGDKVRTGIPWAVAGGAAVLLWNDIKDVVTSILGKE